MDLLQIAQLLILLSVAASIIKEFVVLEITIDIVDDESIDLEKEEDGDSV